MDYGWNTTFTSCFTYTRKHVLKRVKESWAFLIDSFKLMETTLWRKLFMKDGVVLKHCNALIKGIIMSIPLTANSQIFCLIKLWHVDKDTLVIEWKGKSSSFLEFPLPVKHMSPHFTTFWCHCHGCPLIGGGTDSVKSQRLMEAN